VDARKREENGGAIPERLQWHEHSMTFSSEPPNNSEANQNFRQWILALAVSLGVALLVVSPFFWRGNASGHDIAFHASSWLDAAGQWKEGILYPRWTEWANYGFGEPRFIFYPPLSWMLGAALTLVLPGNAVPGVFIVLVQTLAGISMFALARRFFSQPAALFGAACYAANPYALLIVYMRSDFAEQLACAFLPALLLAALQLCGFIENRWRSLPRVTAIFAMLFAAVWLSNAPAGVMASYSMALLFAWAALREKSLRPLLHGAAGLALGFGLTSFYLLPAAYEQRWVNITQALSSGLLPSQNFLYTQIADPEHNLFNWIASSVAILLIVMAGIAGVLAHRGAEGGENGGEEKESWRVMLLLSAAATILMIRPSDIFWEYLPKLRFVQFPWRWMAILAVPYAYFVAAAIARRRTLWIWATVVFFAVGGTAVFLIQNAWWDSEDVPVLQEAIAGNQGFEGTDEYDPAGDDHTNLPQKAPRVEILPHDPREKSVLEPQIQIERWTAEDRELRVTSTKPVRLAVRLLNYPAWRVEVNGKAVTPQIAETTAQIILQANVGTQRISMKFLRTPDRALGDAASAGAGIALLGLFILRRARQQSRNA
jgi:hypothetical protein